MRNTLATTWSCRTLLSKLVFKQHYKNEAVMREQHLYKQKHLASFFLFLSFSFLLAACADSGNTFRMKGRFKNFNQGELHVYSLHGTKGIDTIRLANGKFDYEVPLKDTVLLSVVFPNFSEIPVIATPGASLRMEGDASHLREVEVSGTDDNQLLTAFRLQSNDLTPPEALKSAAAFIKEHPSSPASWYVINKYFLLKADADYRKASDLLSLMLKAAPGNRRLAALQKQVAALKVAKKGDKVPVFSVVTTEGKRFANTDLRGELNIISVWASWNYESQSNQRQLWRYQKNYGSRLQLMSVCLDGNPAECKSKIEHDSLAWPTVCDGQMWDMPIVRKLGLNTVPDNIIVDRSGKIIARHASMNDIRKELEARWGNKN